MTTSPAVRSIILALLTLLVLPTIIVFSWLVEQLFFATVAFGWDAFGELALPLGACICAAVVFLVRNPMHALLALLGVFFATVLMYLMAGIAFVGLVFLIVYVGAVAVLFLFVIMLLNVKSLTATDALVRHPSQVAAMLGTLLLLQQLNSRVVAALDRAIAAGFLKDAGIEPTTGEAILFYVRYQAMDITGLASLYTLHAILFMITTAILLSALMGAIILATVTTERAISISDIRMYSATVPTVAALSVFAVAAISTEDLVVFLTDLFSTVQLDPVPMSYHHRRNNRDLALLSKVGPEADRVLWRRHQSEEEEHRVRIFSRVPKLQMWDAKGNLLRLRPRKRKKNKCRRVFTPQTCWAIRKLARGQSKVALPALSLRKRSKLFRIHATPLLRPVLSRLLFVREIRKILRAKWVWRWRSTRAAYRTRVVWGKDWTWNVLHERYDLTPRFRASERSVPQRVWGRNPLNKLHFLFVTTTVPFIQYWAWRVRAFCAAFLTFLFTLPFLVYPVTFFVEDHDIMWADAYQIYRGTIWFLKLVSTTFHDAPEVFVKIAAVILFYPFAAIAYLGRHGLYFVPIAALFAYDYVMWHGGDIYYTEMHESKCTFMREGTAQRVTRKAAADWERGRERRQRHPDKGRMDRVWWAPAWMPDWLGDLLSFINKTGDQIIFSIAYYIKKLLAWRFRNSWAYQYKPVADAYEALVALLVRLSDWWLDLWWNTLWPSIVSGFHAIEVTPRVLGIFSYFSPQFTAIAIPAFTAGILYCIANLLLIATWRRMYYLTPSQGKSRPSFVLHLLLLLFLIYSWAVCYKFHAPSSITLGIDWMFDLGEAYKQGHFLLVLSAHLYFVLPFCVAFFWLRYWTNKNRTFWLPFLRPVRFRRFYNKTLRRFDLVDIYEFKPIMDHAMAVPYEEFLPTGKELIRLQEKEERREFILHYGIRRHLWEPQNMIHPLYETHHLPFYARHRWRTAFVTPEHLKNPFL